MLGYLTVVLPQQAAAGVVFKFATLAPEGTPWMQIMRDMGREVERQSNGEILFQFYPGGMAGDEREVIDKMRAGQLHGGAFTGVGMGLILPESRVLELPLLFRDASEADHVVSAMMPHFINAFNQQGYVLLSLHEAGPVFVFSKPPLRTIEDLTQAKLWQWQGDPLVQALFKAFDVTPVPLSLPEVLPALQSDLIHACYGTPLGVLAMQWFTQVKYRILPAVMRGVGALVMSFDQWQKLSPDQQGFVMDTVQSYAAKAAESVRQYEQKALPLLESSGIEEIALSPDDVKHLQQRSQQLYQELSGKLYPKALLDRVLVSRDQYRQANPQ
jgi:TRAP-type C4-dicarboxylate transport system substrate-binding protein